MAKTEKVNVRKKTRKGVHAKSKFSKLKGSKLYKKINRGQGK